MYYCKNKTVLKFFPKASEFLKAYTSSDCSAPRGAFINVQGRIVALFDRHNVSDQESWLVIEAMVEERLRHHLWPFLELSDTRIEGTALKVYWDTMGTDDVLAKEAAIAQKCGKMILTAAARASTVSEEEFCLFRVRNRIGLQGVDFDEEVLLNVADDERVSYSKGCYLGQEIIARIHHRGRPSKKLRVIRKAQVSPTVWESATSRVYDPEAKDERGMLLGAYDDVDSE